MLQWLKISNLALIENAEIEFEKGFNVISGETGAGKTIIINAISLLLGKRADRALIRTGANRCEISAGVMPTLDMRKILTNFFEEQNIPFVPEEEIVIRKVILPNSTKNYVNDVSVTLTTLNILGEYLLDFHGPNQQQSLLKPSIQLEILDQLAGLNELREKCASSYREIVRLQEELSLHSAQVPNHTEVEYLRNQVNEIGLINPQLNEDKDLSEKFKIVGSAKNIIEITSGIKDQLYDTEDSIFNRLSFLNRKLSDLGRIDKENASTFVSRFNAMSDEIKDISKGMDDYLSKVELDEQGFARLEERISAIFTLKRKYGPTLEGVINSFHAAKIKLEKVENFDGIKKSFENKLNILNNEYNTVAQAIHQERINAGKIFCRAVIEKLRKLGFLKAELSIKIDEISPTLYGSDKIEIMFCANPGSPMLPLRDVASSGEISRVMLAIKTVLSDVDSIPILIFDEIDSNIGGEVANQVGLELQKLGKNHHVLCISHLPQVASFANVHFRVHKDIVDNNTFTRICLLDRKEKTKEIARMLGGGDAAYKHAEQLVKGNRIDKR